MWYRVIALFVSSATLSLVFACSGKKDETYLRFGVERKQYEAGCIQFTYMKFPNQKTRFFSISQDVLKTKRPTMTSIGSIRWTMQTDSLEELQGKEIDFDKVADEAKANKSAGPTAMFQLERKDIRVSFPDPLKKKNQNMVLKITRIDGKYIEGSFSGTNWVYTSEAERITKIVDVSGNFRANLLRIEQYKSLEKTGDRWLP